MRLNDVVFPCDMKPINANNPAFEFISSSEEENILHKSANLVVMQPLWNLVYVENFVCKILGNEVDQSRWEFISREIEAIFNWLSSSKTHAQLLLHHFEVQKAIQLLWSMVDILGCGEVAFKQFPRFVDWIFELPNRRFKSNAYIEALGDVSIDLICQHEECLTTK